MHGSKKCERGSLIDTRREGSNTCTTNSGHFRLVSDTPFKCRFAGPILCADFVALRFFRGSGPVLLDPIF